MQLLRKLIGLSLLLTLFISCQKEVSLEKGNGNTGPTAWEFKETVAPFKGNIDTAYIEDVGGLQAVGFEGTSSDGTGMILLQVFGSPLTATTYKNPNVVFEYSVNGALLYSNRQADADKFSVTITNLTATSVSGTFTGEVEDPLGGTKTITEGKFTATLKSGPSNPPPSTNCKISNLSYLDIASGGEYASLTSTFNPANQVSKIQLIRKNPDTLFLDYTHTYAANRVNVDGTQYFDLDATGRVKQFHGFMHGDVANAPQRWLITYTYDANGYMTKASYAPEASPATTALELNYTWTNGNLTKIVLTITNSLQKQEFLYEYDQSKTAKNFLCFFPSFEILYNQSAIDFGKNSTNVLSKSTIKYYDNTGALNKTEVSNYSSYVMDANNNVKSFTATGDGSVYPGDTKYLLTYKCF